MLTALAVGTGTQLLAYLAAGMLTGAVRVYRRTVEPRPYDLLAGLGDQAQRLVLPPLTGAEVVVALVEREQVAVPGRVVGQVAAESRVEGLLGLGFAGDVVGVLPPALEVAPMAGARGHWDRENATSTRPAEAATFTWSSAIAHGRTGVPSA